MQRPFPAYDGNESYIFVSYSHADSRIVYPELARLKEAGFHVWYDEGISPGSRWTDDLAERISSCSLMLLFVTANSAGSENCRNEVDFALEQHCSILLVYLKPTELPGGMKLALSGRQAIIKSEHSTAAYEQKLLHAVEELVSGHSVDRSQAVVPARTRRTVAWAALALIMVVGLSFVAYVFVADTPENTVAARSEPLPVLIADFANNTGQPVFDGVLEEALKIGMEGAPFITSFPRNNASRVLNDLTDERELTHEGARLVAVREGVQLVLAGTVTSDGEGYQLLVEGIDPLSGEIKISAREDAASPLKALNAIAAIAETLRRRLGDVTTTSTHLQEIFTSSSMRAVSEFAKAQSLAADWKHAEAVEHYSRAVEEDAEFGRAYGGWAYSALMLGQEHKSRELWEKSLALLNTMTERERLRTLGIYYMTVTRNIDKAIETYQTLIEKFPADAAGHNNLAVAYFSNVQLVQARDAGQRILDIYPSSLLYLCNFALYNMYVADMGPAVEYADRTLERDPNYFVAYLPLIMQQLLNIDYQGAERIYQEMAETGVHGLSIAQLGRADIAMARGDYSSAITILSESIANDDLNANTNNAAIKRLWLARSQVFMGQVEDARLTMESLLDLPPADRHEYERAELHILLGDYDPAIAAADRLSAKIPNGSRALANIIRANVALAQHDHQRAIDFLYKSLTLRDNWLAHYQLGKAYLASDTHVVEAMDEFQSAWSRRGEALAVFLDDLPSYHRLVDVQYWLARTQEDIGMIESAAQNYRFFAQRRDRSIADSMIEDATNRLTDLTAAAAD